MGTSIADLGAESARQHRDFGAGCLIVCDRLAGRLQLPRDMTEALGMRDLVRLEAEPDHIGVWPDRRRGRHPREPGNREGQEGSR